MHRQWIPHLTLQLLRRWHSVEADDDDEFDDGNDDLSSADDDDDDDDDDDKDSNDSKGLCHCLSMGAGDRPR